MQREAHFPTDVPFSTTCILISIILILRAILFYSFFHFWQETEISLEIESANIFKR